MRLANDAIIAAADLSGHNPRLWAEFMSGIEAYAAQAVDQMMSEPPETLPVAQGQCRALAALLNELRNVRKKAEGLRK